MIWLFLTVYVVMWVAAYSLTFDFAYTHVVEHFYLAWTSPGEAPSYINMLSLAIASLATLAIALMRWVRAKLAQ